MKVVRSRRGSFELLPPSVKGKPDQLDPYAEYDEKASRYHVDRPLFATQAEPSRAQTPQMNFESMSHFKKRSAILSSADWKSQESEVEKDLE
jgi:hypothetical protein